MEIKEKDPFGYATQGEKYDIFRPPYPEGMFDFVLSRVRDPRNVLDLGTGTGKVLLRLQGNFSGVRMGVDRSDSQLKVARQKAELSNLNASEVQFLNYDVYSLEDLTKEKNIKFDLVTMGQCLHWFEYGKILSFIAKSLLSKTGVFAVLNYFCEGFLYNIVELPPSDVQAMESEALSHYKKFYKKVKPFFDCDRDGLETAYAENTAEFEKNFSSTEKKEQDVLAETSLDDFLNYMKTYSGYNRFLDSLAKSEEDPLSILEKETKESLENLKARGYRLGEKPIILKMKFYTIVCAT